MEELNRVILKCSEQISNDAYHIVTSVVNNCLKNRDSARDVTDKLLANGDTMKASYNAGKAAAYKEVCSVVVYGVLKELLGNQPVANDQR